MDDTNCFRFLRDNYRAVADLHGARTTVLYLDRPLELLLDRLRENETTKTRAPVTETVLLELARKFEPPGPDENTLVCPPSVPVEAWDTSSRPPLRPTGTVGCWLDTQKGGPR